MCSVGTAAPESLDYDALVDLRMIDFANTSCYVDGADTAPQGTDPEDVDQVERPLLLQRGRRVWRRRRDSACSVILVRVLGSTCIGFRFDSL